MKLDGLFRSSERSIHIAGIRISVPGRVYSAALQVLFDYHQSSSSCYSGPIAPSLWGALRFPLVVGDKMKGLQLPRREFH
jgi:hypothetical protein